MEKTFTPNKRNMLSGIEEVGKRKFTMIKGKSGKIWLIAVQENAADNIYVEGGPDSKGFGGRSLVFELENGAEIELIGPWHSNSESLFNDTGLDIQDKHISFVVIAKERDFGDGFTPTLKDIIYMDEKPVIGYSDRGEELAGEYADKLGVTLYLYKETSGGSYLGTVEPMEAN